MAKNKKSTFIPNISVSKKVTANNTNGLYAKSPIWSFSKCDFDHNQWGINANKDRLHDLILRLNAFEQQKTWGDILTNTSGRNGNTQSHPMGIYKIAKDAQNRIKELNLDEYDIIYSLSVSGKYRIWGVMSEESGTFHLIWIDPNHTIYEVDKRHT